MPKHESLHRYQLVNIGKKKEYKVYHCNIPGCTHYTAPEKMFNVISLCNRCNMPFQWDRNKNRGSVKPHCEECTKPKYENTFKNTKPVDKNAISSLVENILAGKRKT